MHRLRCLVVIGVVAVAMSVVGAGPAFAAKGGNNDTAKLCQKGGWVALGTFANQGDCVNDGAKFGTAGKATCTDPHGINGSFSLDATHGQWNCTYDVPPNPPGELPALQTACDTDAGQRVPIFTTTQVAASPPGNFFAQCSTF